MNTRRFSSGSRNALKFQHDHDATVEKPSSMRLELVHITASYIKRVIVRSRAIKIL